jgi:hypothetical protein
MLRGCFGFINPGLRKRLCPAAFLISSRRSAPPIHGGTPLKNALASAQMHLARHQAQNQNSL